jgi:hypothetical protein
MNLFKLLDPAYLFETTPGYNYMYNWPFLIFFILVFALSFKASELLKKRPHYKLEEKFLGGIPGFMRWFAMLGIVFNFFRDQNIPYIGMRVWLLLIFLSVPAYAAYVWRKYELKFEDSKDQKKKEAAEDKYLPKPKKKKKSKKRRK